MVSVSLALFSVSLHLFFYSPCDNPDTIVLVFLPSPDVLLPGMSVLLNSASEFIISLLIVHCV